MNLDQQIAKRIRKLRQAANLTQEEMSELVSIDTSSLAKIERGERSNIKINTLEKIISGLGMIPKDFFDFSEVDFSKEKLFLLQLQTMLDGMTEEEKLTLLQIFESVNKVD